MKYEFVGKKRTTLFGSWSRQVKLADGRIVWVGVDRGNRVLKIAFKPRGTIGFHWHGYVRDEQGKSLWKGRVEKSIGALGLLRCAGLTTNGED